MKKVILAFLALSLLLNCKKKSEELDSASKTSYQGKAYISGIVKAELNSTNAQMEKAPIGTVIVIEYNEEDLVLNPASSVTYQNISISAKVDSAGYYSASVPTNGKSVTVNIIPQDFEYNKIISNSTPAERTVYSSSPTTVSVVTNSNKIVDINY